MDDAEYIDVPQSKFCGEESSFIGTEVDMYDISARGACYLTTIVKIPSHAAPGSYTFETGYVFVFGRSISSVSATVGPGVSSLTVLRQD